MKRAMCAAMLTAMIVGCGVDEDPAMRTEALRAVPGDIPDDPAPPTRPRPAPVEVVPYIASFSPALGPPAPRDPINDLGVQAILTAVLRNKVDEVVAGINAGNANSTDVRAKVSWSFNVWGPSMFATQYTDRPNENYANVPYLLDFYVHDIEKHTAIGWISVPATRHITMGINLQMFCDQWQTGQGHLKLVPRSDPPYLDNSQGALEQVVNFFLANTVTSYIDSQVRSRMSGFGAAAGIGSTTLPGQCDALGAHSGVLGDPADDTILFSYHPPRFHTLPTVYNQVTVKLTAVKRLVAHDLYGGVLYDAMETPAIDAFANYQHMYMQLPAMVEGQMLPVNGPTMVLDRPANTDSLVLIGNVVLASRTESAYRVFGSSMNFGNGTQSVFVRKSYWTQANPLTGAKPYQMFVDAYELVFQVSAALPVLAQ
jgi:hypothetical protein